MGSISVCEMFVLKYCAPCLSLYLQCSGSMGGLCGYHCYSHGFESVIVSHFLHDLEVKMDATGMLSVLLLVH